MSDVEIVVVTVARDDPAGLFDTCASIGSQTLSARHIIVLGDSRADTWEVVKKHRMKHPTVVLRDDGRGPYEAMNLAMLELADDEYVWFLNSGDTFCRRDALEIATQNLASRPIWGYGPVRVVETNGKLRRTTSLVPYSPELHANQRIAVCHQAAVVRASAIRAQGAFSTKYRIASDFELLLKIGLQASPVQWDEPLTQYKAGGLSDRLIHETIREQAEIRRISLHRSGWARLSDDVRTSWRHLRVFLRPRILWITQRTSWGGREQGRL